MEELKIKKFDIDEVEEITLLTIEQAKKLPNHILACGNWWWLRSLGVSQVRAAYVGYGGDVYEYGSYVRDASSTVRPAFRINNLKSKIGDKVMIGKTWCAVIDEGLVLADCPICVHKFDSESNDWETSEIKRFVNSREFKLMI